MNNAVYGKTMENVRNYIDFELVSTQERMQKCINSPNYKNSHIINDELVGVAKIKSELLLNAYLLGNINFRPVKGSYVFLLLQSPQSEVSGEHQTNLHGHRQLCPTNFH